MVEVHHPGSLLHAVQEVTAVSYIMHFKAEIMTQLRHEISWVRVKSKWQATYAMREEGNRDARLENLFF